MKLIRILLVAMCMLSVGMAQPVINFAGNAASYDTTLARGSMVVLIGSGLGPSPIQVATSFPLLSNFAGSSVTVTVNGVTTDGIMYYASDGQSAFVLDSDTPAGTGTVTLTYNGQSSAPFPITVVDSNVGFYSLDASGSGNAVATFHESVNVPSLFVANDNAVNPGDLVILWGNGLGPVPFDETIGAEFLDMTNVPLQLFVNGQQVEILYRGRSPGCCTSVDNIYFYWPAESAQTASIPALRAANSCSSTISAQIGDRFSNLVTVPSADVGSRICSDVPDSGGGEPGSPLDSIITQSQIDQFIQSGEFSFGFVGLNRNTNYVREPGGTKMEQEEGGVGVFAEFDTNIPDAVDGIDEFLGTATCTTSESTSSSDIDFFGVNFRTLNAGPGILVDGPNGRNALSPFSAGGLSVYIGQFPLGYLTQGAYTLDSSGGPDVGPFKASAQVSTPLNWTNRQQLMTVVRSNGFTATWTGPTRGWVTVSGESSKFNTSTFQFTTKSFSCTAPASQGSLTVPGNIASFVDASTAIAFQFGQLSLDATQLFELPGTGLDVGVFSVVDAITQDVDYQ